MSIPSVQRVLLLPEPDKPLVLEVGEAYTPGAGEILVKTHAVALNPADWKIQKWGFFVDSYPFVLGSDSAGTVVALGEGVTELQVGDRVYESPDSA
jgi:NADPH:quinone reductase-like Zn-dependent oxidoreductase